MAAPKWEFWALNGRLVSGKSTLYANRLQRQGVFTQARGKQLSTVLNRAGSFACTMPLDHPETVRLGLDYPFLSAVEIVKNGTSVWSGFLQSYEDDLVAGDRKLTYVGWGELLRKRFVEQDVTFGTAAANETQVLHFANIVGGQFALMFDGQGTGFINWNANAANVQAALELLSNIDPGDVTVSKTGVDGVDTFFSFEFAGQYASADVPALFINNNALVLGSGDGGYGFSTTQGGTGSSLVEIQSIARQLIEQTTDIFETGFRNSTAIYSTGNPINVVRTFHVGENIGDVIQQMSDVENGYDYRFYLQRETGLQPDAPCIEYYFEPYRGVNRPNARFELGSNLFSLNRNYDGAILSNNILVSGSSTSSPALAYDESSASIYGRQDDRINLGDITSSDVLNAYASVELILRLNGRVTWTLLPMRDDGKGKVPGVLTDYNLGDTVYLTAERGPVSIFNQGLRVFGIDIAFEDNGGEKVTSLQVSP